MSKSLQPPSEQPDRGGHVATKRQQQLETARRSYAERWSDLGHKAMGEGDWETVHAILSSKLLDMIDHSKRGINQFDRLARVNGEQFHAVALKQYLKRQRGTAQVDVTPGVEPEETTLQHLSVEADGIPVKPDVLFRAFRSVYVALGLSGTIETQAISAVPALEYRHQVGERYYSPTSSGSDIVEMIDPSDDLKATLLTGGQGSGKSTAMETIVEDRIAHGHKIIDLIDFTKVENAMYDVPSRSPTLQNARREMGLDAGFEDYDPPDVEIYAPLTPSLADRRIPVDQDTGDPVLIPFVIPASDLTYRQLVMVMPHTTSQQEKYLKSAHQILTNRGGDWMLSDVAKCVREETNAQDGIADRIERGLETVQQKSFIRDRQAPVEYIIDWHEMMQDTDTVTVFTQSTLRETAEKKLIASYLIDRLYDARQQLLDEYKANEYPPVTVAMRELHQIVPKSNSEMQAESEMESYMKGTMEDLIALVRHVDIELLGDTQKFAKQIDDDVAELFHRIFAFGGQKPDIKKVFKTRVDDTSPAEKVSGYNDGQCALVSGDGYTMPIQMAPPRCHHLDAKNDGNGLGYRARHPDLNEELEPAPWNATVPPRLRFGMEAKSPVARFWNDSITQTDDGRDFVLKEDITEAYSKWSDVNGEPARSHNRLHEWIAQNKNVERGKTTRHGRGEKRRPCYWAIELRF